MFYQIMSDTPFYSSTSGAPLQNGYLYFGVENANPEVSPATVYWDSALTFPAAQPVRTIGGRPSRNGTPSPIFSASAVSLTVRDSAKALVYTTPSTASGSSAVQNIAALRQLAATSRHVWLNCYATEGDGGGGEFYGVTGAAPGTYVDNGGTIIVPTGGNGSAAWLRVVDPKYATPRMFGAKGDGATDDTAAIQAAVNYALTMTGGRLHFPSGTYKITAAIVIPFSGGWQISGDSMTSAVILQATSNTPIFKFTSDLTNGFSIRELKFDYSVAQASTNTSATAIMFVGTAGAGAYFNYFNFSLDRLNFNNCAVAVGSDSTTKVSVWGMAMRNITVQPTVSRSVSRLFPLVAVGQPNNRFEHVYVRADVMVGPIFDHIGCENCQMDNIEINIAAQSPILISDQSGGQYDIGSWKLENGTYTAANAMFLISNSTLQARRILIGGAILNYNAGSGANPYIFTGGGGAGGSRVKIDEFQFSPVVTGGTLYIFNGFGGASPQSGYAEIDKIKGGFPTSTGLTNTLSSATSDGVKITSWLEPRLGADKGDANSTVVEGDPTVVLYNTPLTANRTVTLPNVYGVNLFNGLTFTVVRTAAATGASTLTVNGTKVLSVGQFAKFVFRRFGWTIVEAGSL